MHPVCEEGTTIKVQPATCCALLTASHPAISPGRLARRLLPAIARLRQTKRLPYTFPPYPLRRSLKACSDGNGVGWAHDAHVCPGTDTTADRPTGAVAMPGHRESVEAAACPGRTTKTWHDLLRGLPGRGGGRRPGESSSSCLPGPLTTLPVTCGRHPCNLFPAERRVGASVCALRSQEPRRVPRPRLVENQERPRLARSSSLRARHASLLKDCLWIARAIFLQSAKKRGP